MTESDPIDKEKYRCVADVLTQDFEQLRNVLLRFCGNAPQCLLFEGANANQRLALAYWWAALLNCNNNLAQNNSYSEPCFACANCLQILSQCHNDILIFDGGISNKDDLASQGSIRAFNMDNIRNLKNILSNCPSNAHKRVIILMGLDGTRVEAANALLKVLEEPSAYNVFILLAAQREQLLPTLVSRSWVLTLPWNSHSILPNENVLEWENALGLFLQPPNAMGSGHGWLTKTGKKNAVDINLAHAIIQSCQKALAQAFIQTSQNKIVAEKQAHHLDSNKNIHHSTNAHLLIEFFCSITDEQRFFVIDFLSQCQDALSYAVNPARVMDWLATQLYSLHVK